MGNLLLDASSPASVYNGAGDPVTGSFTPPANSLLVVWIRYNTGTGNTPTDPTVTDNLGVHLTYTLIAHNRNPETSTAVDGALAVWTAPVTVSAAMTVTAHETDAATGAAILVQVFTDSGGTLPGTGAVVENASASAITSIAQGFTATVTGSRGLIGMSDFNAAGVPAAGTGCTVTGGDAADQGTTLAYGCALRSTADGVAGATTTMNLTIGSTTDARWIALEVTPGATAAYGSSTYTMWPGAGPNMARRFTPPTLSSIVPVAVSDDAEQTTHDHTTSPVTATLAISDGTAPAITHATSDAVFGLGMDAGAAANAHTTSDASVTATTTDGTAPALGHTTAAPAVSATTAAEATTHSQVTPNAAPGVGAPSEPTTHAVATGDVTATATTTDGTAPDLAHATSPVTATTTTTDTTAPDLAHTTYDATVSTATILNADAGDAANTHTTGDPTPSLAVAAEQTTHSHVTGAAAPGLAVADTNPATAHTTGVATPGLSAPAEQTTHAQVAGAPTPGLGATDTAPALAHTTAAPAPGLAVPAGDAATTHTAYDAGVSMATDVAVNAELAPISAHTAYDATVSLGGSTINANAEAAATTHTTYDASYGLTPPAGAPTLDHKGWGVTATQTTTSSAASIGHAAFDATVHDSNAHISVDTDLAWTGIHDGTGTATNPGDATTTAHSADSRTQVTALLG